MVRIKDIVKKLKKKSEIEKKEVVKVKDGDIEDKLRNLNRKMLEECERGNLFNAAFIADQIKLLSDEYGVYPVDINWGLVKELQKILVKSKVI